MKIYHIAFSKAGTGLSGGEKCMIEIIRYFKSQCIQNILLTTDNGKETYEKLGLIQDKNLTYITINSYHTEQAMHIFISYLMRLFYFFKDRKQIVKDIDCKNDILICHSDFFPDTLPSWSLSKYFKKRTLWWFHMLAPSIFRGYGGQFTNRLSFPNIRIIHYRLNQLLFFLVSSQGVIINVNPYYIKFFKNRKTYTLKKFGGEVNLLLKKNGRIKDNIISNDKKYDLIFLGRFHPQKGLFELPKILNLIKNKKSDIKMAIIGGGNKKIEKKLFEKIHALGLDENVKYLGFISTDEKYDYMRQSKIFIFPSYYESYPQVILEAMAIGLPIVSYNLPVFDVFKKGIIKVPILNNKAFAREIIRLLDDNSYFDQIKKDAQSFASTTSWKMTGNEVLSVIKKL